MKPSPKPLLILKGSHTITTSMSVLTYYNKPCPSVWLHIFSLEAEYVDTRKERVSLRRGDCHAKEIFWTRHWKLCSVVNTIRKEGKTINHFW